jgi:protease I
MRNVLTTTLATIFLGVMPMSTHAETRTAFDDLLATRSSAMVPRVSTTMLLAQPENAALRELLTTPPANPRQFAGKRIAVVTSDGVEEIELTATLRYFRERGAAVEILSPAMPHFPDRFGVQVPAIRATHILTIRYMENAGWVKFDRLVTDAKADEYDAVVIPGGAWNPDTLRADPAVLDFVRQAAGNGGVIASLCHGPWVLADADLLSGRRATAWGAMRRDIERAGATYVDEPVVIDGNIVTSRGPVDLADFLTAIGKKL